jgi:SAM-dependent methyltransferase
MQDSSRPEFWDSRYREGVTPWDAHGVPADLRGFAATLAPGTRVLVPGCGSAHELRCFSEAGAEVLAIDFSPEAIERAKRNAGSLADRILLADFFQFDAGSEAFDVIYERAFLCALPRTLWARYAARTTELLGPGKRLAGIFFYGDSPRGPPFGTSPEELHGLLDATFELTEDRGATDSLAVFQHGERWQVWRRHECPES